MLSYIEIWENTGDLNTPNYQGTLLDSSDDHKFNDNEFGEIIRINPDECKNFVANLSWKTIEKYNVLQWFSKPVNTRLRLFENKML